MAIEIERKYLVKENSFKSLAEPILYKQGYLSKISGETTIRIRLISKRAFITIKGSRNGISRKEFEYEIPFGDGEELFELCGDHVVEKLRYKIEIKDNIWEVDEYLGLNQGLIVAEIELKDENQEFIKPDWVGEEVSEDARYTNAYLASNPYKYWNTNK